MTNEIVKVDHNIAKAEHKNNIMQMPTGHELVHFMETAKHLATCPYYQKLGSGGILAIWLTAREMGLPPMMCLNGGMYTFSGAVTLSSQMMNMMVVRAGHRVDILVLDENTCKLRFHRCDRSGDSSNFEYEYNIQMAEKAGLANKDNWKKNRRDMLFSRCLSGGARKFMPDVIMNAYVHGEIIEENAHVEHHPVVNQTQNLSNSPVLLEDSYKDNKTPQRISEMEAEALAEVISMCPAVYAKTVDAFIKDQGFKSYEDLSPVTYEKLMSRSVTEKENYIKQLKEEPKKEKEEEEDVPF